jgi:hypothetical protein
MNQKEAIARQLASELWRSSTLRHGMFTPPDFFGLCYDVIINRLEGKHISMRAVENGEAIQEGDLVKETIPLETFMPCRVDPKHPAIVGETKWCVHGQYFRPIP